MALASGASLLGLGVNALGDFPLQMPTAPFLLWLQLGMLGGLWAVAYPAARSVLAPRWVGVMGAIVCAFLTLQGTVTYWHDRAGQMDLLAAMSLGRAGFYNEAALLAVDAAYQKSSRQTQILEYRAVTYANYRGRIPLSTAQRLAANKEALQNDPYSLNDLINTCGQLVAFINQRRAEGASAAELDALNQRLLDLAHRAIAVGEFAPHTYALLGMGLVNAQRYGAAQQALEKALALDPNFMPARQALGVVNDILAGRR